MKHCGDEGQLRNPKGTNTTPALPRDMLAAFAR